MVKILLDAEAKLRDQLAVPGAGGAPVPQESLRELRPEGANP